jgi:hypothetical protein
MASARTFVGGAAAAWPPMRRMRSPCCGRAASAQGYLAQIRGLHEEALDEFSRAQGE